MGVISIQTITIPTIMLRVGACETTQLRALRLWRYPSIAKTTSKI